MIVTHFELLPPADISEDEDQIMSKFRPSRLNNCANLPRKPDILECNLQSNTAGAIGKIFFLKSRTLLEFFPHIAIVSLLNGREMETVS